MSYHPAKALKCPAGYKYGAAWWIRPSDSHVIWSPEVSC